LTVWNAEEGRDRRVVRDTTSNRTWEKIYRRNSKKNRIKITPTKRSGTVLITTMTHGIPVI
jgi:hypothetical protein